MLSVSNAIDNLVKVQALDKDERLTPLGSHLASLPVDVHVGKMILFGAIFRYINNQIVKRGRELIVCCRCLDPIITIAACISFKSPFVRPFGKEDEADRARDTFKTGIINLYKSLQTSFFVYVLLFNYFRKLYLSTASEV